MGFCLLRRAVAAAAVLSVCACSTPKRITAEMLWGRDPAANEAKVEQLPPCARMKYDYLPTEPLVETLDADFRAQAEREGKALYEASEAMAADTGGTCRADGPMSLVQKPNWCRSKNWNGPYIDYALADQYRKMELKHFNAYRSCWQEPTEKKAGL